VRFVILDLETYFADDYTLSKMTTEAYIRDPRFQAHGAAIKWSKDHAAKWYDEPQLRYVLAQEDWSDTFLINHHCLKGDVEVLTRDGWRSIESTPVGAFIMQWDSKTGRLTWGETSAKIEGRATEMLSWNTQFHRCSYTTEHRMAFSTPDNADWRFLSAQKISAKQPNNVYIPVSGIFESDSLISLSPDEARLMEAIRADGSWKYKGDLCYGFKFTLKKTRKIERLAQLFRTLGVKGTSQSRDDGATVINVNSCDLADRIFSIMGAKKLYGVWVGNLSLACREAILQEAEFWDGHRNQRRATNSYALSSKHSEVIQAFQLMAHLSGWSGQVSSTSNVRGFTAHVPDAVLHKISIRKKLKVKLVTRPKVQKGLFNVFCFSVPTGAFLIRSEGRVCVTGNSHFDGLILSHHYGVLPRLYGCTLSMARLLLGNHISVSLDSVRKEYGLPPKTTPYNLFRGKRWGDLDEATRSLIAEGACDEVESIWKLFGILAKDFPKEEYLVVDQTIRMFTQPVLRADTDLLAKIWSKEENDKKLRLASLDLSPADFASSDRFAALLRDAGVEPETKEGPPRKNGERGTIYAFAKTDPFMEELLEHEDPYIRALAEARLGEKSNILQTRAETLGWMASRGPLCVYLRMYGAHTTRWSGGDSSNFQNFKKPDPEYPEQAELSLRDAILPPQGYILAKPDASQIECRLLNFVAGQDDVIERFRNGQDPYVNVASAFYGYPVNKKDHPKGRQVGKVLELQAGYGSGGPKIAATLRTKAGIILTPEEGIKARDAYRDTHPAVVQLWKAGGRMLSRLAGGPPFNWGPTVVRDGQIYLPNECPLNYQSLEFYRDEETGEEYWRLKTRRGWTKMYGAKLVENLIQALARVVISQAMIRIVGLGYRIVGTEHDSLWILIPKDGKEKWHIDRCLVEMSRTPEWLPGIPLAAECN
jgi:DNA polymerase bacteriophage-type